MLLWEQVGGVGMNIEWATSSVSVLYGLRGGNRAKACVLARF